MYFDYFFSIASDEITLPNYNKPKFILMPSFKVFPVAPVFLSLSEPAKSTNTNLEII
jgi:hypothetical protein